MKKIAFTQRLIEAETYPEIRDALDVRWADLCTQLHILPVILPSSYDFASYFSELQISGIVFTGGNDLSSVLQSQLSLKRDIFERALLQFAIEQQIPVIGICRGMQLISEYFGAVLQRVEGHTAIRHEIITKKNNRYITSGISPITVHSYHSYAVSSLPDCLKSVSISNDGVIEAVEHINLPIVAQMWHPERETPFNNNDLTTLRKLFGLGEYSI